MSNKTIIRTFMDNARDFRNNTIIRYKKQKRGHYVDLSWGELEAAVFSFACGMVKWV